MEARLAWFDWLIPNRDRDWDKDDWNRLAVCIKSLFWSRSSSKLAKVSVLILQTGNLHAGAHGLLVEVKKGGSHTHHKDDAEHKGEHIGLETQGLCLGMGHQHHGQLSIKNLEYGRKELPHQGESPSEESSYRKHGIFFYLLVSPCTSQFSISIIVKSFYHSVKPLSNGRPALHREPIKNRQLHIPFRHRPPIT